MAYDRKYGKVTLERKRISDREPVVVFRAQDKLLPALLGCYVELCQQADVQPYHVAFVKETRQEVEDWQDKNFTKLPDTHVDNGV